MSRLARARAYLSFADPFATPVWVEVTDRLGEWGTTLGRQVDLDQFQASTCTAMLDNSDRALDPLLTNGPLAGANLVPRRRFKIEEWWNLLTLNQASLETDTTGWTAGANTTIARSTTVAQDGVASLRLTSTAAGNVQASTSTGTAGVPVSAGEPLVAMASFRSGVSARSARVEIGWYSAAGTLLSTSTGSTVTTTTGSWTQATVTAVAPSGAVFAAVSVVVLATGAGSELHYADQIGLFPADAGTPAWSRGGPEATFSGFVPTWEPMYSPTGVYGEMPLRAHDALGLFAEMPLPDSTWTPEIQADTPAIWYRLSDTDDTLLDSSTNARHGTYQTMYAGSYASIESLVPSSPDAGKSFTNSGGTDRAFAVSPYVISGTVFSIECWCYASGLSTVLAQAVDNEDRVSLSTTAAGGLKLDLRTGALNEFTVRETAAGVIPTTGPVYVVAVRDGATITIYVNGAAVSTTPTTGSSWDGTESTFGGTLRIGTGNLGNSGAGTVYVDEVAVYTTALSAAQVLDHYNAGLGWPGDDTGTRLGRVLDVIGWPAADRVIATGATLCQAAAGELSYASGNALGYMQKIERSEQGQLYADGAGRVVFRSRHHRLTTVTSTTSQGTFGDGAGELGYAQIIPESNITRIENRALGSRANGGRLLERISELSKARFGLRTANRDQSGLANQTDLEIIDLLDWQLQQAAAPRPRVRGLVLEPIGTADLWPQVLQRGIGDRVTVRNRLTDGSLVFDEPMFIEGIVRRRNPGRGGQAASASVAWHLSSADQTAYLILDDATFGQLDSNAFAF